MENHFLLTPFFFDEALAELASQAEPGWDVVRPSLPDGGKQERMVHVHRPLAELVAKAAGRGARPVSFAGDCCATLPVMAGLRRAGVDPVLVWLDAHGDFNTWETTPSGFLGGMPLAMLVGRGEQNLMEALGLAPFPEERVVLTDARDLDPGERDLVEESSVVHLTDPRDLLTSAVPEGPLYVHFDVDFVDPEDMPAVYYPAPGGLRAEEARRLFRELARKREIVAVSLSSWNPGLDGEERSRDLGLELLRTFLG